MQLQSHWWCEWLFSQVFRRIKTCVSLVQLQLLSFNLNHTHPRQGYHTKSVRKSGVKRNVKKRVARTVHKDFVLSNTKILPETGPLVDDLPPKAQSLFSMK